MDDRVDRAWGSESLVVCGLELVLNHLVELLNVVVLALSPDIELTAERDQLRESFLEHIGVVDLNQESQLRSMSHWSNLELSREIFLLTAH